MVFASKRGISMSTRKLSGADYLLILLYLPDGKSSPIRGRTRITKMMFLFKKEIYPRLNSSAITIEDRLPEFEAYKFGPFSRDVFEQIDVFCNIGFVEVTEIPFDSSDMTEISAEDEQGSHDESCDDSVIVGANSVELYSLSEIGRKFVREKLLVTLTSEQLRILTDFKNAVSRTKLRDLLGYVYRRYPEYTTRSEIREEVLG